MTTKHYIVLFALTLFINLAFCQYDDEFNYSSNDTFTKHEAELKDYFWNQCDSTFRISEVPNKWENESAVILSKRIEYTVKKKGFSNKLLEHYYYHIRVKLLDNNAVDEFSEYTFKNSKRQYRGAFSYETINLYTGVKVEKENGEIIEVDLSDAVEKEISSGYRRKAYNKLAIPNTQIGDIIDIYYCIERKFPISGFHEFSPVYFELQGEYPILNQTLHFNILRNCYLNAKSINGAPDLKCVDVNVNEGIDSFELTDKDREKFIDEEWSNSIFEVPALKFQAYFAGSANGYLNSGYESFFAPISKLKSKPNTAALADFSISMKTNIMNAYNPYRPLYINTYRYLKRISKTKEFSTEELTEEAYYFIREFWYQQNFHLTPQFFSYQNRQLDIINTTFAISAALIRLKRPHKIIYLIPKNISTKEELLFLAELTPGIKTSSTQAPIYITDIGPTTNCGEIPSTHRATTAFSTSISNLGASKITTIETPEQKANYNTCHIESEAAFFSDYDSLLVKSKISLLGAEKLSWDSVVFVSKTIQEEFNKEKYSKYIFDKTLTETAASKERKQELLLLFEEEEQERLESIKEKIKQSFSVEDVSLKHFNLINSGRWKQNPNLIFEIEYAIKANTTNIGSNIIFSTNNLTSHLGSILESERKYDIYLPYKKEVMHSIRLTGFNVSNSSGFEKLTKSFESDEISFSSQYKIEENSLVINSKETINEIELKKTEWLKFMDFKKSMYDFKNTKLKLSIE
ncbi:DUF3857 domain-containing protein [Labilibacter marinus]|uniref:DUF3857 domain-containing protein n=1 Tax=Labilibacter marinus TaxID=1477105 RepID=UPI00094F626A|nr:DUF3857 domain-containing protein [Labilibacter marinus]